MAKKLRRAGAPASCRGEMGYCFLLLAFFAFGVLGGSVLSDRLHTADELALYLSAFLGHGEEGFSVSAVRAAGLYFRYPLLAALLGLLPLGTVFLPFFLAFLGAELSFSVAAFLAVFGKEGLWAAFCLLGLRSVLVLPCCFLLACLAFAFRRKREARGKALPAALFMGGMLGAGVCLEVFLIPRILPRVLSHMNF